MGRDKYMKNGKLQARRINVKKKKNYEEGDINGFWKFLKGRHFVLCCVLW